MCSCGGSGQISYTVTYPDGRTETKPNATAARIAAAKVPGATFSRTR